MTHVTNNLESILLISDVEFSEDDWFSFSTVTGDCGKDIPRPLSLSSSFVMLFDDGTGGGGDVLHNNSHCRSTAFKI